MKPAAISCFVVAVFLSSVTLVASDLGLDAYGISSDEQGYFDAAAAQVRWIPLALSRQGYSPEVLREHFEVKPEIVVHPALSRWLGGASWAIWHGMLDGDEVVGFRLAQAFSFGLLCSVLFLAAMEWWGLAAGFLAVGLTWTSGRLFGHAHILTTDLLLTTLWTLTALWLVRRPTVHRWGGVSLGMLLGAALATKLTAILLCAGVLPFLAMRDGRRGALSIIVASVVAALFVLALHPDAWVDPLGSLARAFSEFRAREHQVFVPTIFFGTVYGHRVPVFVPTVHLLITFPTVHLILATVGLLAALPRLESAIFTGGSPAQRIRSILTDGRLFLGGIAVLPLAAASLPSVPAHDLERLTLPIQPFLILLATFGAVTFSGELSNRLSFRWPSSLVLFVLGGVALLAGGIWALRVHPYELASFNAFVGGPAGANIAGFDVAYSKTELNGQALAAMRRLIGSGDRLYANFPYLDLLEHQGHGRLPQDFTIVRHPQEADWAVLVAHRSWKNSFERFLYRETSPAWALRTYDGVILVGLYHLNEAPASATPPPEQG